MAAAGKINFHWFAKGTLQNDTAVVIVKVYASCHVQEIDSWLLCRYPK
jgi:hypothetical protein